MATADGAPVAAAGVFTQNLVVAAPVTLSRRHLAATGGRAAAVVVNSGNANAATGARGLADAEADHVRSSPASWGAPPPRCWCARPG